MSAKFRAPIFKDKCLELRYENAEICIYGTGKGLKKLSQLILRLVHKPKRGHIHLEDYDLLTDDSLTGAVAIFNENEP